MVSSDFCCSLAGQRLENHLCGQMPPKQLLLQVLLQGCRSQPENKREKDTLNTHQKSSARPSWPKWKVQVSKVVQHVISAKTPGWHRGGTTGLRSTRGHFQVKGLRRKLNAFAHPRTGPSDWAAVLFPQPPQGLGRKPRVRCGLSGRKLHI